MGYENEFNQIKESAETPRRSQTRRLAEAKGEYVVVTANGFLSQSGYVMPEYPDAIIFDDEDEAVDAARRLVDTEMLSADVVEDYGISDRLIWSANRWGEAIEEADYDHFLTMKGKGQPIGGATRKRKRRKGTSMQCMECGRKFKKVLGPNTFEVKCPGCGSYDTEPDSVFGESINEYDAADRIASDRKLMRLSGDIAKLFDKSRRRGRELANTLVRKYADTRPDDLKQVIDDNEAKAREAMQKGLTDTTIFASPLGFLEELARIGYYESPVLNEMPRGI